MIGRRLEAYATNKNGLELVEAVFWDPVKKGG
jgi:hypothetical protein